MEKIPTEATPISIEEVYSYLQDKSYRVLAYFDDSPNMFESYIKRGLFEISRPKFFPTIDHKYYPCPNKKTEVIIYPTKWCNRVYTGFFEARVDYTCKVSGNFFQPPKKFFVIKKKFNDIWE